MIDLEKIQHHPAIEDIVDLLCSRIQTPSRGYFRVEVAYFLAKMAATMRTVVNTKTAGSIPVSVYAFALAESGFGKGHSLNILEREVFHGFEERFTQDTILTIAEDRLWGMASENAASSGKTEEQEKELLDKELERQGTYPFTFPKITPAALEQIRQLLLLSGAGAINLQIDEVGDNFIHAGDILPIFLELYDQGYLKHSITKNTSENKRNTPLLGKTPANALLFGTPDSLLDGGPTENAFYKALETGYARRSLFAWGEKVQQKQDKTPAELYAIYSQAQISPIATKWAHHCTNLADPTKFNWQVDVPDPVGIEHITYRMWCEDRARSMPDHANIRKAEMSHRHFKTMKLAGALAFVDESDEVTMDHLHSAIKLVEESGDMFDRIMTREQPYVKLARFIAAEGTELTHADMHEKLPYYKAGQQARQEMMTLATAWGYKNHVLIKKSFIDGIEFFTGDTLKPTNLDEMTLSYSDHFAYDYQPQKAPWDQLHKLTQAPDMHWCNHHFLNMHRTENNAIPGFNMVAFDFDGGATLDAVHDLLKEYAFMTYTTKRHTDQEHRFRLLMPINYELHLDEDDYKDFMNGLMAWMPFPSDEGANQRARKWQSHDQGQYQYNDGELLDCLRFIPKTSKNEAYKSQLQELGSLDNLERWFAQRISSGNRNNQMIKYALALVDSGMSYAEVESSVLSFNARLSEPMEENELRSTVLVTTAKKMHGTP